MRATCALLAALLLAAAPAAAQECEEEVLLFAYEGTIEIQHVQSLFNCCSWIEFEVDQGPYVIDVHEWERLIDGGCDCLCCFDAAVWISGLEPGDYLVTIVKHTEHGGVEALGPWVVTVEGISPPVIETTYVPCPMAAIQEPETSWGVIKALYSRMR